MSEAIRITGIRELNKALRQINKDLPKRTRLAFNEGAEIVAQEAAAHVPVRTGRAKSTYRARSSQREARVAIGGAKARYVPWLDFGGRTGRGRTAVRPFYKKGRYLFPALDRRRPEILAKLEEGVVGLVEEAGLEVT